MTCLFREPGKKAIVFVTQETHKSRLYFSDLTALSSADFCNSIAVIFQKLGTLLVCPEQLYFLRGIKVGNPERANRPTFPAWVANQNKGFTSKCMLKGAARDIIKWLNKETSIRRLWIS